MITFPSPDVDLYPVFCGPAAWYPRQAHLPYPATNVFVAAGDWFGYFRDRVAQHEAEQEAAPIMPPPEHTTADPWPDDIAAPTGAARLRLKAEAAGWDARIGYSRAWRNSVGKGVFVLHHHVRVQARRTQDGVRREVWALWIAKVPDGDWKFSAGQVDAWPANVTAVTAALSS